MTEFKANWLRAWDLLKDVEGRKAAKIRSEIDPDVRRALEDLDLRAIVELLERVRKGEDPRVPFGYRDISNRPRNLAKSIQHAMLAMGVIALRRQGLTGVDAIEEVCGWTGDSVSASAVKTAYYEWKDRLSGPTAR